MRDPDGTWYVVRALVKAAGPADATLAGLAVGRALDGWTHDRLSVVPVDVEEAPDA